MISWSNRRVSVIVSVFVAFIVYCNSLSAGFVYDDSRVILSNQDILPSTTIENIFKNDFWGTPIKSASSHGSYRPLCILTFRLNYLVSGFKPYSYHLVNVLLHCLCTYLVYQLGNYVLPTKQSALASSLLFAVHPIHTEAVSGIVGRADILSCIFYILTILSFVQSQQRTMYDHFLLLFLSTCATLCKEIGITALVICIVLDFINLLKRGTSIKSNKTWRSFIIISLSFIILLSLRVMIMGNSSPTFAKADNPTSKHASFVTRSLTFLYLPVINFLLLIYPYELSYDWGMDAIKQINDIYDIRNIASLLFYGSMLHIFKYLLTNLIEIHKIKYKNNKMVNKIYKHCDSIESVCNICSSNVKNTYINNNYIDKNYSEITKENNVNYYEIQTNQNRLYDNEHFNTAESSDTKCTNCIKKLLMLFLNIYFNESYHYEKNKKSRYIIKQNDNKREKKTKTNESHSNFIKKETVKSRSDQNENKNYEMYSDKNIKCKCKKYMHSKLKPKECLIVILSLIIIPFVPATNIFFYVGFVIAERVLYIPSIGYCYLIASAYHYCVNKTKYKMVVHTLFAYLLIVYSFRTVARNNDWLNEENLYRSGISINPPKSYGNLGSILSMERRYDEAEYSYRMALKFRSNMADVHYNLGILLQGQDRSEEAISSYQKAIYYRPSLALAYLNLGQLLVSKGQKEMAESIFKKCSQIDGKGLKDLQTHEVVRTTALVHLGKLLVDQKQFEKAVEVYKEALQVMPSYYQPSMLYSLLGEALTHLNRHTDAENMYKAALKAQPNHVASHLTYGKLLSKNRTRLAEAELWFRKAQKLAPDDPNVYQHYGQFLLELGRYQEAAPLYIKSVGLAPSEYDSIVGAATALRYAKRLEEAEDFYRRATKIRPLDASSHSNLGAILHLNRKYNEAVKSYTESIRLQPDDNTARSNLRKLQSMKPANTS